MEHSVQSEFRRPVPIALAALAAVGWLLLIGIWISSANELSQAETRITDSRAQLDRAQAELRDQQQASGTLAELLAQIETAEAERSRAEEQQAVVAQSLEQSNVRLQDLEGEVQTQGGRLEAIRTELDDIEGRLADRTSELTEAETNVAAQTQALTEIGQRVETARDEEEEFRRDIAELSAEAARLAEEAAGAEARVQEAREAEAATQEELQATRLEFSRIAEERTTLENELESLAARRESVSTDIAAAEEQRRVLQDQVTDLASSLEQRSRDLADIEQRIQAQQATGSRAGADGGIAAGAYQAGPMQAYFSSAGTFRMTSAGGGRNVTGRYSVAEDVLVLEDAVGQTGAAVFPMRCRIEPEADGFRLAGTEGSCSTLEGVFFERTD